MRRCAIQLIITLLRFAAAPVVPTSAAQSVLAEQVDFNDQIRPIFTQHCSACHGGVKQAGELSLIYEDQILRVIEPGSPRDSYLFQRVTEEDDESRMPPAEHGPRLSNDEIELLNRWIEQGARWSPHWAYQKPQRHKPPEVTDSTWPRQPIDYFLLEQLDARGVRPAPDERPERWLRRVSLDLVGLPPTIEEREAFLSSLEVNGEQAYVEVVDRLLASPRFGERWASVWFDQVRYADSRGLGEDSPRDVWKYRDWVIDALNRDLPYDEFTVKQIAGDLLPNRTMEDRIATSVHRLTQTNEEGGTDDEEFRVAAVLDRVHTTWQTWLGTSMGCAQCHDHPYDPFRQVEYYQFMAYFNNTADCDLSDDWPTVNVPIDQNDYARTAELDRDIEHLTEKIWRTKWRRAHSDAEWRPLQIATASSSNSTNLIVKSKPVYDEYETKGTIAQTPVFTFELPIPEDQTEITGVRVTVLPLDPTAALANAEVGFVMSLVDATVEAPVSDESTAVSLSEAIGDEPFPYHDPMESLESGQAGFGAYTRVHHPRSVVFVPEAPVSCKPGSRLVIKISYGVFDLASFSLVARRGYFSISDDPTLTALCKDYALQADKLRLEELRRERNAIDGVATPVLVERPPHLARPSHTFVRGLFLTKAEQVAPGIPKSLCSQQAEAANRLALANWLVSDENPLTARVAVNRYWARMFGVGLVATEEDFGSAGERPSHPELLDDLAVRFREDYGWSVKQLLREMALSRAYRQSSRVRADLYSQDRDNRWLARGPRHTLPAETLRDQMLAISGLLSDKMHGPPVQPPLPPGVWRARRGEWKTPPVGDEERYRRSVYTYAKRSIPFPMFVSFDAPSRDVCIPKRLRSNTPLQSLMLLNDAAFVEFSQAFADRMREHPGDVSEQISYGFLAATCREPRRAEIDRLAALHQQVAASEGEEVAMEAIASVLLNLDEVLCK